MPNNQASLAAATRIKVNAALNNGDFIFNERSFPATIVYAPGAGPDGMSTTAIKFVTGSDVAKDLFNSLRLGIVELYIDSIPTAIEQSGGVCVATRIGGEGGEPEATPA